MKKILLDVETLSVTSFETVAETHEARGTVRGHASFPGCNSILCETALYRTAPCNTCYAGSCYDTCGVPKTGDVCYAC